MALNISNELSQFKNIQFKDGKTQADFIKKLQEKVKNDDVLTKEEFIQIKDEFIKGDIDNGSALGKLIAKLPTDADVEKITADSCGNKYLTAKDAKDANAIMQTIIRNSDSTNKNVTSAYHVTYTGQDSMLYREPESMKKEINFGTANKAERMKFASQYTQIGATSHASESNQCGAACIVAGAMIKNGQAGLTDLIRVVEARGNSCVRKSPSKGEYVVDSKNTITGWDKLEKIKENIKNGKATQQDLLDLQHIVYEQLKVLDFNKGGISAYKRQTVDVDSLKEYMNTSVDTTLGMGGTKPLKSLFSDMNIKLVNTAPGEQEGSKHFVVFFDKENGSAENSVYDPWPRVDNSQVITNNDVEKYHKGVINSVR